MYNTVQVSLYILIRSLPFIPTLTVVFPGGGGPETSRVPQGLPELPTLRKRTLGLLTKQIKVSRLPQTTLDPGFIGKVEQRQGERERELVWISNMSVLGITGVMAMSMFSTPKVLLHTVG